MGCIMLAYFDRTEPYYLTKEQQFDGNPVEIPEGVIEMLDRRKVTLEKMEEAIFSESGPEDSAQRLADLFMELLNEE